MQITMYVKTGCPWCIAATAFMQEKGIRYTEKNVSENQTLFDELEAVSGQVKAPTVVIDGEVFPDVGKEEIEAILKEKGIID